MKLTRAQKKTLQTLGGGGVVAMTEKGETEYTTLDGGHLDLRIIRNLIAKGALTPNNDGLLEGFTQTYSPVAT